MTQPTPPVALTSALIHTEITTDPTGMGYSQYMTSGPGGTPDFQAITNLLNDPSRLAANGSGLPKFVAALDVAPLWQAVAWIDGGEYEQLTDVQRSYLALVGSAGPNLLLKDPTDPTMQTDTPAFAHIKAIFPEGKASRAALDRLTMRAATRAESLTNTPHTSVSVAQVRAAFGAA